MANLFIKKLYEEHHASHRDPGFSVLKEDRGRIFSKMIGSGKQVLDIGCRDGALTSFFINGNNVVGIDIDNFALSKARDLGIDTLEMDLYGDWNKLDGRRFDVIVAGEVLEHLYYPEKVIKVIKDHLSDDGVFVGSVPNAFSFKNRLRYLFGSKKHTPLSDPTHINQFGYRELKNLFKKEFRHVEIIGLGRYSLLSKFFPNFIAFDLLFKVYN